MDRTIKHTNPVALIGMFTTIGGILLCLSLLFLPVTIGATVPEARANGSVDLEVSMRWIQPILGQAIVEDTLIKQRYGSEIGEAIKVPNQATAAAYRLHGMNPYAQASAYAGAMVVDHATRVQWVMGRLIAELTRHRVRAGTLTADRLAEEENQRIITIAQQAGKKLDDIFITELQDRLGQVVVSETLNQVRTAEQSRERVGLIF
jgi:hypothetical protein